MEQQVLHADTERFSGIHWLQQIELREDALNNTETKDGAHSRRDIIGVTPVEAVAANALATARMGREVHNEQQIPVDIH